jgi:hypothetical protein
MVEASLLSSVHLQNKYGYMREPGFGRSQGRKRKKKR